MRPSRRTAAESVNGASTVSALGTKISGSPVRQARYFAVSMAVPPPSPIIRATPSNASRVFGRADGRRYWRRSPAMAIGLTDHIWSWEEFLTYRHHHYSKG